MVVAPSYSPVEIGSSVTPSATRQLGSLLSLSQHTNDHHFALTRATRQEGLADKGNHGALPRPGPAAPQDDEMPLLM